MKADTCKPGQEQWEVFYSQMSKDKRVQYDYRTPDGKLFSCIAKTLEYARKKRDNWLKSQEVRE